MLSYQLNNGQIVTAKTKVDFIMQLNNLSWFNHQDTMIAFMKSTSDMCNIQKGCIIRYDTIENFIDDLIANDFISEISNVDN